MYPDSIRNQIMKFSNNNVLKSLAIGCVLITATGNALAQKATLGVRFMPTISAFDMKTSSGGTVSGQVALGFGIGAFVGYNFSNYVGIQGEIIYSSISQKYKEQDVERKINLKYVNIPLMLSLNTGITKQVNFNVVGGPQIGISMGGTVATTGGDGTTNSNALLKVKKGDLGLAYGAGFDFGLNEAKTSRLGFGFRGVFGMVDISDNNTTDANNSYYFLGRTHISTYSAYIGLAILI